MEDLMKSRLSRIVLAVALAVLVANCSINNKARAYANYDQVATSYCCRRTPEQYQCGERMRDVK
jgi:hypothetical protein